MTTRRILLVDDEPTLTEAISRAMPPGEFTASTAATAEDAFFLLHAHSFDLVVLDISLPQRSGLDLLQQLRALDNRVPVLLLTSHNEPADRVRGLEAGADDYLGKPFSLPELIARVRALLRRSSPAPAPVSILAVGDLRMDVNTRVATRAGVRLEITAREFDLLVYLAGHEGRVVSREMLAQNVWHETARFTPINNVIDVQIARLRRKLDEPFPDRLLHTVRGVGFTLREDKE